MRNADQGLSPDALPARPHGESLALARAAADRWQGRPWRFSAGLTVARVLPSAEAKRAAAREHGTDWVDMESAVVARLADRLALPWLAVRVISDALDDDLDFILSAAMESDGSFSTARALRHLLIHPARLPAALRLNRQTRRAAQNLCEALGLIVPQLLKKRGGNHS